ncbi:Putative Rho GTPaseactivating protein CG5521like [Caligus rogercresseyi]|uniref:Rho GTPaseactivating protein CG5521like n=1 Tax=Caligus rogercresseyi TaxID=217165 RepID=A0A7T8H0J0_CALRO|nr:Putative Rho GTPaseactivating protein CG5521like [Caligus rogercresseyi]
MDNLDDLLSYLSVSSPELLEEKPLNAVGNPQFFDCLGEKEFISGVLGQRTAERDTASKTASQCLSPESSSFQFYRSLFNQLGPQVHLLKKSERLIRELKNLDNIRGRETHKIAVIYVAPGQEDKTSILDNSSGSEAYEASYRAGLGVELESHRGFMAGLRKNKSTGETSPYYATSFLEIMFHVATRMPSQSEESLLQKTRHLGNDEIHIVEFCDVLIIIYPLPNRLFRIQISRKPECIVDGKALPGLVRATALNASRAKRHVEERSKALEELIRNHRERSTYEDFITRVFSPRPLLNLFQQPLRSSLTLSEQLRPRSKTEIQIQRHPTLSPEPIPDEPPLSTSPKSMKKMSFKTGKVKGIPVVNSSAGGGGGGIIREENNDERNMRDLRK